MTPLDDELRTTLSSRAAAVAPPADPLAGIEARAGRIRRRRTLVSVSGAAAAVAAVALAVPSLMPSRTATVQPGTTPSATAPATPTETAQPAAVPANLLRWGVRGMDPVSPSTLDLRTLFAQAFGRDDVDNTAYSPLYVGKTDSGVNYTMGQAWFEGADKAYTVSYATGGTNGPEFFLGQVTPTQPWGLAYLIGSIPGRSTDLLVVVPRPMIGEILYAPGSHSAFVAKANGRSDLNGIAFIDRSRTANDDQLEALDGDGNLDRPLYKGPVAPLLCGLRECG